MNSVYETILKRRSIRSFKDDLISDEILEKLMKAAMAAPSARNIQPWKFYIIKNLNVKEKLTNIFKDFNAPILIVVAGDLNKSDNKSNKFWTQDCSAATQNILLAATELNLGSCWCGIYPKEKETKEVIEILNLEENIIPLSLIQIGYPNEEKEPRTQYDKSFVVEVK